jgi:hypothetical protein
MIGFRYEGDPAEIADLIARMQAAGIEVDTRTGKNRGDFVHQYGTCRAPDYQPQRDPIRVQATVEPRPTLPSGDRRPRRRT